MRWLALLVLALALVAAGCGGSDDESSASDDTAIEETTTSEETTDTDTDTDTGSSDTGDFDFADEDCQALVAAYVSVSSAFAAAATGSSDDLSAQADAFSQYADQVPEEIRADVETLAAAYAQYIDVLQDVDLEPGTLPSADQAQQLQDALQNVGSADVTAASERLSAWTTQNCTG